MRRPCIHKLVLCAFLAVAPLAAADTLVLANGEFLDGSLKEIADGVLVFETALAGVIVLPVDEAQGLKTEDFWAVWFNDGRRDTGRFRFENNGSYLVSPGRAQPRRIALADVDRAAPATPEAVAEAANAGRAWSLQVDLGYHWRWGTRDYSDPYAAVRFDVDKPSWALDTAARIELSDREDFPEFLLARMDWRIDLGEQYYAALGAWAERDVREAVRWRSDFHVGAGRNIWDDEYQRLRAEAGLALTVARFDPYRARRAGRWRPDARALGGDFETWRALAYYALGGRRQDHDSDVGLLLRLTYDRDIPWNGVFQEDLTVLPSLGDWGELRARSESRVLFPMTTRLTLKFDLLLDYERTRPHSGVDPWRTTFGAGLVFDF